MKEIMSSGETPKVSRNEVLEVLKKMKESGVESPYETKDPRAHKAQELLDKWTEQSLGLLGKKARDETDNKARLLASLDRNTILIDAGYDDEEMKESAVEWLNTDIETAIELGLDDVILKIADKIIELGGKLIPEDQEVVDRIKNSNK